MKTKEATTIATTIGHGNYNYKSGLNTNRVQKQFKKQSKIRQDQETKRQRETESPYSLPYILMYVYRDCFSAVFQLVFGYTHTLTHTEERRENLRLEAGNHFTLAPKWGKSLSKQNLSGAFKRRELYPTLKMGYIGFSEGRGKRKCWEWLRMTTLHKRLSK